jgi:hypothetical protein
LHAIAIHITAIILVDVNCALHPQKINVLSSKHGTLTNAFVKTMQIQALAKHLLVGVRIRFGKVIVANANAHQFSSHACKAHNTT